MTNLKCILNTKNGVVLKIHKINNDSVVLLVYPTDSDIINSGLITVPVANLESLIIPSIIEQLGADFIGSESQINWLFEQQNRLIRMKVDKDLFICESQAKTYLGQILEAMASLLAPYVINERGAKYGLTYLEEFEAEYVDLFQPLVNTDEVIIEKLEIDEFGNKSIRKITDLNEFRPKEPAPEAPQA